MNASRTLKNKRYKIKCRWKRIEGYDNHVVSNLGQVKNLKTGRILKPQLNKDGYYQVNFYKKRTVKTFYVHRLVANAFIPNLEKLPEINHKDKVKTNNRVDNLEWCDRQYNIDYSKSKPVVCIETGVTYKSAREAGRQTGVRNEIICGVVRGRIKTAGGFHWRYADEYATS